MCVCDVGSIQVKFSASVAQSRPLFCFRSFGSSTKSAQTKFFSSFEKILQKGLGQRTETVCSFCLWPVAWTDVQSHFVISDALLQGIAFARYLSKKGLRTLFFFVALPRNFAANHF